LLHEEVELKQSINRPNDASPKENLGDQIVDLTPSSGDPSPGAALVDRIFGSFDTIWGTLL
jgi:hypothetical protein